MRSLLEAPVLARLPALATTGAGGVPFARPRAAVAHVWRAYELPFCPRPAYAAGAPLAFDAVLDACAARPPAHRLVKLGVTGPVTLCWARLGDADAVPDLARALAEELAAAVRDRAARLAEFGVDTVLLVDEPVLGRVPEPPAEVWEPLRGAAAAWGMRVGGAVPWPLVRDLDPDLVALDLDGPALDLAAGRALGALCERGARVLWGVPTADGGPAAAARLARAVALVAGASGADADVVRERSLVAPASAAAPGSDGAAEDAAVAAVSAAALLERWAGGGARLQDRAA
jgi:hypothetical protein